MRFSTVSAAAWIAAATVLFFSTRPAGAQFRPAGEEFQVNVTTSGVQRAPDIAVGPTGDFLIVWEDHSTAEPPDIFGRLFFADTTPASAEFPINAATAQFQAAPTACATPAGEFVVSWTSTGAAPGPDGDGAAVVARRFSADGSALGAEFVVNETTSGSQVASDVCCTPDGGFLATWASTHEDGASVFARRFDATDTPLGGEFRVNADPTGIQFEQQVACGPGGEFVVVWRESGDGGGGDGDGSGVFGRVFDSEGNPLGPDFLVNDVVEDDEEAPDVCIFPDGDVLVAWTRKGISAGDRGTYVRVFDPTGVPRGPSVLLSPDWNLERNSVACRSDGGIVAIDGVSAELSSEAMVAAVTRTGAAQGAPVQANADAAGSQALTRVALLDDSEHVLVVWSDSARDGDGSGLFARRMSAPCRLTAQANCRLPAVSQKSRIRIVASENMPDRAALVWKWLKGETTSATDWGRPDLTETVRLCVYDDAGAAGMFIMTETPPGGLCDGKDCWKTLGNGGFRFKDKARSGDGVNVIRLKPGPSTKAKIVYKANGANLLVPALPLQPEFSPALTAQLQVSNGQCWAATYSTRFLIKNTEKSFRARAD